jgi:hypothetical protein
MDIKPYPFFEFNQIPTPTPPNTCHITLETLGNLDKVSFKSLLMAFITLPTALCMNVKLELGALSLELKV